MKKQRQNYTLCEVTGKRSKPPRYAENLVEQGLGFKILLCRPERHQK